jgi:hypothetical protein
MAKYMTRNILYMFSIHDDHPDKLFLVILVKNKNYEIQTVCMKSIIICYDITGGESSFDNVSKSCEYLVHTQAKLMSES